MGGDDSGFPEIYELDSDALNIRYKLRRKETPNVDSMLKRMLEKFRGVQEKKPHIRKIDYRVVSRDFDRDFRGIPHEKRIYSKVRYRYRYF